jgi:apolipoprotein N-acyltransferase
MTKGKGWMRCGAAIASGLLVAGLFPPFHFSALVWVAFVPLLWALMSLSGKRVGWKGFGLGFLAGAVSCLIQFQWVATVAWLGAVLLPLYLALYWGAFGAFVATWGKPAENGGPRAGLRSAFCIGAVWAGLELLRGWMITGFGWNSLGVAFHETPVMAQGADLLGVCGISLVLISIQTILVLALRAKSYRRWDLGVAVIAVLTMFLYGKWRIASEHAAPSVRLKTLLVQLDVPQVAGKVLWTDVETHLAYEEETLKALDALKSADGTRSAKWPDWVMWPECALTGRIFFLNDHEKWSWQINEDTISQVRTAGPFTLIYGVNEWEAERDGDDLIQKENGRAYNSLAVMPPDDSLQTYRKHHLVIFGETIPLVDTFPLLKTIYEQQAGAQFYGSFTAGESLDPLAITAGTTEIGAIPTICFEDSVPRLVRKFIRPGPQVIINVTDDGWFKHSPAGDQHFATARFRAIELRRPMLRAANTGVSAAIDSTGSTAHPDTGVRQVLTDAKGSHFTRGSLLAELNVPLHPSTTLYARIGDWGIIFLTAAALLWSFLTRRKPTPGITSL